MDLIKTPTQIMVVENKVLTANLLQIKEIEVYAREKSLPLETAAQEWIAANSEYWRKKHNRW
jgi:hypothetical protein